MRGNHVHAAFEREREHTRIGVCGSDDLHGVFAAGVREQGQTRLGHSFPESSVARIVAVHVLAIRQQLQHHRAARDAAIEFVERIMARGMDTHGRDEFAMLAREPQHVVVRHME